MDIDRARIAELFDFNRDEGALYWRTRPRRDFATDSAWKRWNTIFPGRRAGNIHPIHGYVVISLGGVKLRAHRIIWTAETGEIPNEIDHGSGDRAQNHPSNLSDVTRAQNTKNRAVRSDSASRVTGVIWCPRDKRWYARINIDGKQSHLGTFRDFNDAVRARKTAERQHGYHPNHAAPCRPTYRKSA